MMIAADLDITPSRVNHHIRNLVDAGILYRHRKLIYLRGSTLRAMVQELRKDALRMFDDLESVADGIDREYGPARVSGRQASCCTPGKTRVIVRQASAGTGLFF